MVITLVARVSTHEFSERSDPGDPALDAGDDAVTVIQEDHRVVFFGDRNPALPVDFAIRRDDTDATLDLAGPNSPVRLVRLYSLSYARCQKGP